MTSKKISDICDVIGGFAFQSSAMKSDKGRYQIIKMSNLYQGTLDLDRNPSFLDEIEPRHNQYLLQEGDVLMTLTGTIGKKDYGYSVQIEKQKYLLLNQRVCLLRPKAENVNGYYLLQLLRSKKFLDQFFESSIGGTGNQSNVSITLLKDMTVVLPEIEDQTAIADLLSTLDLAIEQTEQLIAAKEKQYTWLLSSLISNDKHPRGQIRNFATEVSKRHNSVTINRVLSVTNNRGFVLPEDQFARRVSSSDLSNYKVVTSGQYAYNPSRINVGSIARLDNWDTGVLSPMYVVFKIDEQKANSDFFLHWLSSHEAKERISKSAQGSVRETVGFADLGTIPFPLPSLNQQQTVATTLNTAQKEIGLLKNQANAYRKQKRGLMQKLLTGQWRVKINEGVT